MSGNTRRELPGGAAALAAAALPLGAQTGASGIDFPLEDYHLHLNSLTIGQAAAISRERGVKYGVMEHAGATDHQYPIDWSIATAKELGLAKKDMFQPAPPGRKPIQIRRLRT